MSANVITKYNDVTHVSDMMLKSCIVEANIEKSRETDQDVDHDIQLCDQLKDANL